MKTAARYAKGITAIILGFAGAYNAVSANGVTGEEWFKVTIATVIVGAGVIGIPNAKKKVPVE